jgi:hypothetical protein
MRHLLHWCYTTRLHPGFFLKDDSSHSPTLQERDLVYLYLAADRYLLDKCMGLTDFMAASSSSDCPLIISMNMSTFADSQMCERTLGDTPSVEYWCSPRSPAYSFYPSQQGRTRGVVSARSR